MRLDPHEPRPSRGPETGHRRAAATACLLALAVAAGTASLAGCGHQTVGTPAAQTAKLAPGGGHHAPAGTAGGDAMGGGRVLKSRAASLAPVNTPSGVTGGALFGGNNPVVALEPNLGRKLAIVRLYYFIGDSFPGKHASVLKGGRTVLVSLDSNAASYASIAAGKQDAAITSFLRQLNQAAIKYNLGSIYVSFEHEPDNESHRSLGAPVQFLQAWDHVHQLAVGNNLDWNQGGRLHWVLILIHDSYGKSWRIGSFWPGASEVDILAADGYNSFGCGSGGQSHQQTPADTFGPLLSFAAAQGGMPVFLAEWGSDDIPAGEQATYISQMQSYVAGNSVIAGAMYWDTHVGNCNYKVDGISASISALAAMGQSAALQGHV
jgi:hypothetical protein